jgi:hypothetical protein
VTLAAPPTLRIRVENIRLKPNIPAGMNSESLLALVQRMRTTSDDPEPVLVTRSGDHWRLEDGRHRFLAAVIAGRPDILATISQPEEPQ